MKFLTFGEIMLRLKAPGQECFFQSPMLEATFAAARPTWPSPLPTTARTQRS